MANRTITTPFDPETQAELRLNIALHRGYSAFSDFDSNIQTVYDRIIDSSAEYLSQRFGHEPWMLLQVSISLAADANNYTFPATCRQVVEIIDTYDGKTTKARMASLRMWMEQWAGQDSHPWDNQREPYWFFESMSDDNPPQQVWRRVPTPDQAVTGTALVRPYLTLRGTTGDNLYTHIPANAAMAQMDYIKSQVDLHSKDFEGFQAHKASMEDHIAALNVADNPDRGHEGPIHVQLPGQFVSEMQEDA